MVISQQLIQEIDSLVGDKSRVLGVHETVPVLLWESAEDIVVLGIQLNLILVKVVKQVFCAKNFGNLDQLIRVAVSMEEGFFSEDHGCKHGSQRPHIKRVIIFLEIDE